MPFFRDFPSAVTEGLAYISNQQHDPTQTHAGAKNVHVNATAAYGAYRLLSLSPTRELPDGGRPSPEGQFERRFVRNKDQPWLGYSPEDWLRAIVLYSAFNQRRKNRQAILNARGPPGEPRAVPYFDSNFDAAVVEHTDDPEALQAGEALGIIPVRLIIKRPYKLEFVARAFTIKRFTHRRCGDWLFPKGKPG